MHTYEHLGSQRSSWRSGECHEEMGHGVVLEVWATLIVAYLPSQYCRLDSVVHSAPRPIKLNEVAEREIGVLGVVREGGDLVVFLSVGMGV
jgi:hypothetical protein